MSDLDKAIAFYRDGLGLDVQGPPSNADANPALRNMFGLPDAQLRWSIGRAPGIRGGVEIVEIKKAGEQADRAANSGFRCVYSAGPRPKSDDVFARIKQAGAPVVTTGGAPVTVSLGAGKARVVVVKDPDGHFVEIVQPDPASRNSIRLLERLRQSVFD